MLQGNETPRRCQARTGSPRVASARYPVVRLCAALGPGYLEAVDRLAAGNVLSITDGQGVRGGLSPDIGGSFRTTILPSSNSAARTKLYMSRCKHSKGSSGG